jgi:hypothetical protein
MSGEARFQNSFVSWLRKRDALVFNFVGNAYQRDIPDIHVSHIYWRGWLELKTDKRKLTDGQRRNILELRKRGENAECIRYVDGTLYLENVNGHVLYAFADYDQLWSFLAKEQLRHEQIQDTHMER